MNRVTALRIAWIVVILTLSSTFLYLWSSYGHNPMHLGAIVLVCLIPGRIQGMILRDLFTGRRLLDLRRFSDALIPLSRFINASEGRRLFDVAIWLGWPGYSTSARSMALNNRGVCHLETDNDHLAELDFIEASRLDPISPLPYWNLAILARKKGDVQETITLIETAKRLGFSDSRMDRFQMEAASALSKLEGKRPIL